MMINSATTGNEHSIYAADIRSSDLCGKNAVLLAGEGGYRIIGHSLRSHLGNPDSNKEKQIWVIREKKTKARGNNKKRPCVI